MRLDKYLTDLGKGTRSAVKELIKKGRVKVEGVAKAKPETPVDENSIITLDGERLVYSTYEYYILNKPSGYVTARTDDKKKVVMELIPSTRTDLSPVGRLDEDTEGVLLITNDGELNHRLVSPRHHVKKRYFAELDADLPDNAGEILSQPIEFSDFTSHPAEYEKIDARHAYLTITEGKFHQVKRMFHHIGCEVIYLRREAFGPLTADGLAVGDVRALTEEEIAQLKR